VTGARKDAYAAIIRRDGRSSTAEVVFPSQGAPAESRYATAARAQEIHPLRMAVCTCNWLQITISLSQKDCRFLTVHCTDGVRLAAFAKPAECCGHRPESQWPEQTTNVLATQV